MRRWAWGLTKTPEKQGRLLNMNSTQTGWMLGLIQEYANAQQQARDWKSKELELSNLIKKTTEKRFSSTVSKKLNSLCDKHSVSKDRYWTVLNYSISDGLNYSTTPPQARPCVYAEFLLYIHEQKEICRDEIKTHFNIDEMETALVRIGKMMASVENEGGAL